MMAKDVTQLRPGAIQAGGEPPPATAAARDERLRTLYAKWNQFAGEYGQARQRRDQEVMTNLRGLMILIKKEIVRLGGEVPEFPAGGEHHLADV